MLQCMLCLLITPDINVITVSFCKLKVSSAHTDLALLNLWVGKFLEVCLISYLQLGKETLPLKRTNQFYA